MEDLLRHFCPYPTVTLDGEIQNGISLPVSPECEGCMGRHCKEEATKHIGDSVSHSICPRGLSVFSVPTSTKPLILPGLVEPHLNQKITGHRRKQLKAHRVHMREVETWFGNSKTLEAALKRKIKETVDYWFSALHSIKIAMNLVMRNAEAVINDLPGETFDDKVDRAKSHLKSLFHSSSLLSKRMNMADYVSNPKAAKHGVKRATCIYEIFDRMYKLFIEEASEKDVSIYIEGRSENKPFVYPSFETLALILLDNAVKYSQESSQIKIVVSDENGGVKVRVSSYGPLIPSEVRDSIFNKGFRIAAATEMFASGSGLGLYIARIIANANGFDIHCTSEKVQSLYLIATNSFWFVVPGVNDTE